MTDVDKILQNPVSRRAFLARMGAAGLGAAASGLLLAGCGGSSTNRVSAPTSSNGNAVFADQKNFPNIPGATEDNVVLNFALTLETLEADLYRQAINVAAGKPQSTPAPANDDYSSYSLAVPAGSLAPEDAAAGFLYLQQYSGVEAAHRDFLRGVLGSAAVPANANGYKVTFGSTLQSILTLISVVEEQGVRAYLGAAGFLTTLPLIQTASTIYTTEARHSSGVNYILGTNAGLQGNFTDGTQVGPTPGAAGHTDQDLAGKVTPNYASPNQFEYFNTPAQVLQNVKPFFA